MALWEWAGAGAVFLAAVVFCVRLMKRGLTTLEDERAQCLERIRQMEEKIQEDQKNMASSEHLRVARAGLEDLLRLAGNPPGMRLESLAKGQGEARGEALVLHLPEGEVRISLNMRERELKGVRKVVHGHGRWHLNGLEIFPISNHRIRYRSLQFLLRIPSHIRGFPFHSAITALGKLVIPLQPFFGSDRVLFATK